MYSITFSSKSSQTNEFIISYFLSYLIRNKIATSSLFDGDSTESVDSTKSTESTESTKSNQPVNKEFIIFQDSLKELDLEQKKVFINHTLYSTINETTIFDVFPVTPFTLTYLNTTFYIKSQELGNPLYMNNVGKLDIYLKITVSHESFDKLKEFSKEYAKFSSGDLFHDPSSIVLHTIEDGSWWGTSQLHCIQPLDCIFISKNMKEQLINRINLFTSQKDKYKRFGRPYKLNILLCGKPGAGKTSIIRSLASYFKKECYICSINKHTEDRDLFSLYKHISGDAPIIAIEDIDSVFDGRESKGELTFTTLINVLDGINTPTDGMINIITTNIPEKLDSALMRPGRIDLILRFEDPEKESCHDAYFKLVEDPTEEGFKEWYKQIKTKGISMAAIVDSLFRYSSNPLDGVKECLEHNDCLKELAKTENSEKMYL